MQQIKLIGWLGFGLGLASANCVETTVVNPNHCMNNDGDAFCDRKYDGERPFCGYSSCRKEVRDGCLEERPDDDACYSPCGNMKSLAEDEDCEGVAEGSSSGTMTSGPTTTVSATEPTSEPTETLSTTMTASESSSSSGPSGCVDSSECTDAAAPICVDTLCMPCTDAGDGDAECLAKDAGAPACRDDGQCVQCTSANADACGDTTPVCDGPSSSCVGCTSHEQCEATACDIASGACFEVDCVVEVDDEVGGEIDYDNLEDAMMDGCVVIVHELDGEAPYVGALTANGITVALLAADGEQPVVQGTGGDPSLSVTGDAIAYVRGLRFSQNTDVGISVNGASVWLDRSEVIGNDGGGIVLTNGASASLRNCFVGGDVNDVAAVEVTGGVLDVLYSTLGGGFGAAAALRCDAAATVDVRNSLLVARTDDPELDCAADSFVTSASETDVGDMNINWFGGYAAGDFSLTGNIPDEVLMTALWLVGDPPTDIDGSARPDADGTADVAGADVP